VVGGDAAANRSQHWTLFPAPRKGKKKKESPQKLKKDRHGEKEKGGKTSNSLNRRRVTGRKAGS